MRVLQHWDAAVLNAVRWMLEWIPIGQARIEQVCIVLTLWASHELHPSHWPIQIILAVGMWMLHRDPAASRHKRESDSGDAIWRIAMQLLLAVSLVFLYVVPKLPSLLNVIEGSAITLFWYLISIADGDRKRGRRRRIAIAKLKELLGARWTPEPLPV